MVQTAEEVLENKRNQSYYVPAMNYQIEAMIEFAKLHREAILKEVSEKANLYLHNSGWKHSSDIKTVKCHNYDASINKDSILNCYPPENIK